MASLIKLSIDVDKIKPEDLYQGKKGRYLLLTVGVQDEVDDYGNNASCWLQQSKEERESKKERKYYGNGSVLWTDGNISKAEKRQTEAAPSSNNDDLPF